MAGAAITGVLLWGGAGSPWLYAKMGLGALAVLANLVCATFVFRRAAAAKADAWESFATADAWQHKSGAVVLVALVAALAIGIGQRL